MDHEEDVTQRDVRTSTKRSKANRENLRYNSKNPVVLGNALLIAGISATLGYGAYQRQRAGKLSWETISWWTGAVGLFATADYFVSKYVFIMSSNKSYIPFMIFTSHFLSLQMVRPEQIPSQQIELPAEYTYTGAVLMRQVSIPIC